MKRDADFFEGSEPVLLYIAKKLKDALALEKVLTEAGFENVASDAKTQSAEFWASNAGFLSRPRSMAVADLSQPILISDVDTSSSFSSKRPRLAARSPNACARPRLSLSRARCRWEPMASSRGG